MSSPRSPLGLVAAGRRPRANPGKHGRAGGGKEPFAELQQLGGQGSAGRGGQRRRLAAREAPLDSQSAKSSEGGDAIRHTRTAKAKIDNPVRDVGRIESDQSTARALSMAEATDLRAKIHTDPQCRRWDLVDFTDFMLATGLRIGEAGAVRWEDVDLDAATVAVSGTVVRGNVVYTARQAADQLGHARSP